MQDPTEKHFGDVGILDKYKYNNNKTHSSYMKYRNLRPFSHGKKTQTYAVCKNSTRLAEFTWENCLHGKILISPC